MTSVLDNKVRQVIEGAVITCLRAVDVPSRVLGGLPLLAVGPLHISHPSRGAQHVADKVLVTCIWNLPLLSSVYEPRFRRQIGVSLKLHK